MAIDRSSPIRRDFTITRPTRREQQTLSPRPAQRVQLPVQYSQPYQMPINRKKWHLDENTGEYHRVRYREGNRVLVDTTTYGDRWKESALAKLEIRKMALVTVSFLIAGAVLWQIAENTPKPDCILPGAWAIIFYLSAIGPFIQLVAGVATEVLRDLGPEPVPQRPRREQAERQQVHGAGRFMNREEIHRAASGETSFPMREQQYED